MSNYGASLYGINYYGNNATSGTTSGTTSGYYKSSLTADQIDYRKISLSWKNITPKTNDIIYAWKIVKTVGGAPDYPNGVPVVTSDLNSSGATTFIVVGNSYIDTDTVFPAGVIVTYSMWALVGTTTDTRNWILVGNADAIIVDNDNDTTYKLLKLLPNVWTNTSGETLGEPDLPKIYSASPSSIKGEWVSGSTYYSDDIVTYTQNNIKKTYYCTTYLLKSTTPPNLDTTNFTEDVATDIYTFLKNFGFYYDKLRAEVKAISNISDYRIYPHKLLPYAITSLGFNYEPSLGDNYHRSLYRSGNVINSLKGTRLGLQKYIKSLTNFDSVITLSDNLLPSILESSFEGDHGNWYAQGGYIQYRSRSVTGETSPAVATSLSNTKLTDGYGLLTRGFKIASLIPLSSPTTLTITTTDDHALSTGATVNITGIKPSIFNVSTTSITKVSNTKFSISSTATNLFDISGFTHTGNHSYTTVTAVKKGLTTSYNTGLVAGDIVTITGSTNFNGTWTVLASPAPSGNTFSIAVNPPGGWSTSQTGSGVSTINLSNAVASPSVLNTNPSIKSYGSETSTEETLGKLIPISPGVPYLFSGWAKATSTNSSTNCTVTAYLSWYNAKGVFLSTFSAGGTTTLTTSSGTWSKFESNLDYAQAYAPANAAYAGIQIVTSGLALGDSIALDYFSLTTYPSLVASVNYGIGDYIYNDGRDVKIVVKGARTNYINNPNFEEGLSSWNVNATGNYNNGSFTQNFSQTDASFSNGSVVAQGNGVGSALYSDWIKNLTPSTYYTFSIYVKNSVYDIGVKAAIEFNAPQKLSDQVNASVDSSGPYFKPTSYKTTSSTVNLSSDTWKQISVTALSPEYFGPNGLPSAVVSVEFTSTPSGTWYVDSAMLEESITPGKYFQGNGGVNVTSYLNNTDYIYPSDCAWETRLRTNFVKNPGFEGSGSGSTTGWVVTSGSAATLSSQYGVPAKFGTYVGAVSYTTAATSTVATSVYFPTKMTNGSTYAFPNIGDVVSGSVYVKSSVTGTFTLNITSSDSSTGSYSVLGNTPKDYPYVTVGSWVRLNRKIILNTSIFSNPYVNFEVNFTPYSGSGTTGTWYLDGAQLEVGDIVSAYVDTSNAGNYTSFTSGSVTGYSTSLPMTGIGRSYYWPNKTTKFSRLASTLTNYLPLGSTYTLQYGQPNTLVNETLGSIVKSSLFANGIYGWSVVAATSLSGTLTSTSLSSTGAPTIARYIGAGSLAKTESDYNSGAYTPNFISLTNTNNKAYYGIQQKNIKVSAGTAYKLSTALSYKDTGSRFTPQYVVTWFDEAKVEIRTDTVIDSSSAIDSKYISSRSGVTGYWGNFASRMVSPNNAAYANISIVIKPTAAASTNKVYLSRVIVIPDYSSGTV